MKDGHIVALGRVCIDEYYQLDAWPKMGEKKFVLPLNRQVGGMIANAASVLAGYGVHAYLLDELPDTDSTDQIRKDLKRYHIDDIGVLCGLFNGALVARLRIPPIIATMASMNIFRGIAIVVTKGDWITGFPKYFNTLGQGRICGIPIPFWIFAVITASCGILMKYFNIGRKIYAVGGNINAAELAGMDVVRTKLIAYMISGGLIGLAGTVYASMVGTISASTTGSSLGFQILASALIGGMSINGGKGTVIGTFLGVMLLGVISNGLILSRVSEYWVDTVTGSIIIVALSINAIKNLRNQRSVMI